MRTIAIAAVALTAGAFAAVPFCVDSLRSPQGDRRDDGQMQTLVPTSSVDGQTAAAAEPARAADGPSPTAGGRATGGAEATMRFTDAQGRPRQPSAAERAALAAAFQADLADLTRDRRIPTTSRRMPSGATSAVVPPSRLRFLTAHVDEAGRVALSHAEMSEGGKIERAPSGAWPEE